MSSTSSDRQLVSSGSPYEPTIGFSRAVRVGDRVIVAGTAPVWPDGSCDPDVEVQTARCLEIITAALAEAGARPEHVVRTRMFLTDAADGDAVGRAHGKVFGEIRPAATMVVVSALLRPEWKIEIEAEAVIA
ncbi:MAG TPA: RidA family protein [Acidimicrobiales bacterium]|jgi:enamine deaminase RidA (YjgF/YER057c/UK114 family)|nr:RidA family protein [Acidimicrobiales bacterium]